jgi:hypothetical protein
MSNIVVVKTPDEEFQSAESYGYVYGYIIRRQRFPVYVNLGEEKEYIPSFADDDKTEYRIFQNCIVYVSETDENLDNKNYIQKIENALVKICC